MMTLEVCSELTTSLGDRPLAASAGGSMSTMICRNLPPNGGVTVRPGMVNSLTRMKFRP